MQPTGGLMNGTDFDECSFDILSVELINWQNGRFGRERKRFLHE